MTRTDNRRAFSSAMTGLCCILVLCAHFSVALAQTCFTTPAPDPKPGAVAFSTNPATPNPLFDRTKYVGWAGYRVMSNTFDPIDAATCPWAINTATLKWWQNAATWGGSVPAAGSNVVLPNNTRVIVNDCSFQAAGYRTITIPASSELIFMDAPINLIVKDVIVKGAFLIGGPKCRVNSKINITLNAVKSESATLTNGIVADENGRVEIHGKQFHHTWTRLAATAKAGDRVVWIQDKVNWEPGQRVVITTSQLRDELFPENEVLTIRAISADGKKIEFEETIKFLHYADTEYQTEIGLLDRRIRVVSPAGNTTDRWGGHLSCMGPNARCRYSGVYTRFMGQWNVLGRYPFHLHLLGNDASVNISTVWVKDSACENAQFRCVVMHGSNRTHVTRNVAYDINGHAFYLEDGVEEETRLEYNLAAFVHTIFKNASGAVQGGETVNSGPLLAQPADVSAAPFYISNVRNYIIGNAASGGWTGFALPILPKPIGNHKQWGDASYWNANGWAFNPGNRPGLEFDGNTAHSAGYFWSGAGSCLYSGGNLLVNADGTMSYNTGRNNRATKEINGTDSWIKITNTKVWMCHFGANTWGDRLDLINLETHDCYRAAQLFGESSLLNALVEGRGRNPYAHDKRFFPQNIMGIQFYDTHAMNMLYNVTFQNFNVSGDDTESACIVGMTHSDIWKPWFISATSRINYINVDTRVMHRRYLAETGSGRMFNWVDTDGSSALRGRGCKPTIIGSEIEWWNGGNGCWWKKEWNSWLCDRSPGREIGNLQVLAPGYQLDGACASGCMDFTARPNITQAERDQLYTGWVYQLGQKTRKIQQTMHRGITGLTGLGWYWYWPKGTPKAFTLRPKTIPRGTYIISVFRYKTCYNFNIFVKHFTLQTLNFTQSATQTEFLNSNGTSYYTSTDSYGCLLWIKLSNLVNDYNTSAYEREGVKIWRTTFDTYWDIYVTAGDGVGADVIAPGTGKTADDTVPPAPASYPITVCPNGEDDLLPKQVATGRFPYRYTCSPQYWCPGVCPKGTCPEPSSPCQEYQKVGATWQQVLMPTGTMCDDGDVNTLNDTCSAAGVCKGSASSGPLVINAGTSGWQVQLTATPNSDVQSIRVWDTRNTTYDLAICWGSTWCKPCDKQIFADLWVNVTAKDGKVYTSVLRDFNGAANKALTLTKKSTNKYWLEIGSAPFDYIQSATATVRGYVIPLIVGFSSWKNPASGLPAGFNGVYDGTIEFKFTFFNGSTYTKVWPSWDTSEVEGEAQSGNLFGDLASRGVALASNNVVLVAAAVVVVGLAVIGIVVARRRRAAPIDSAPTEMLLEETH